MARRAEKSPEFGGHPVGAASLPGCVRPVARPYLARGVPARSSRAFSFTNSAVGGSLVPLWTDTAGVRR